MDIKKAIAAAQPPDTNGLNRRVETYDARVAHRRALKEQTATRDAHGRFIGGSGGPGRPPSFEGLIREMTGNGAELVLHALDVMRADARVEDVYWPHSADSLEDAVFFERAPSIAEQQAARNWLTDRGFGKSVERLEVAQALAAPEIDYSRLTQAQRLELERLMVLASPLVPASTQTVDGTSVPSGELEKV